MCSSDLLFGDYVRARFDRGGNVPRIPSTKLGAEVELYGNQWTVHLHAARIARQDNVAYDELPSDSYVRLSLYADYHWPLNSGAELKIFLRGNNLLDEEIRNHSSLLKNFAPEAGRSVVAGIRFTY